MEAQDRSQVRSNHLSMGAMRKKRSSAIDDDGHVVEGREFPVQQ